MTHSPEQSAAGTSTTTAVRRNNSTRKREQRNNTSKIHTKGEPAAGSRRTYKKQTTKQYKEKPSRDNNAADSTTTTSKSIPHYSHVRIAALPLPIQKENDYSNDDFDDEDSDDNINAHTTTAVVCELPLILGRINMATWWWNACPRRSCSAAAAAFVAATKRKKNNQKRMRKKKKIPETRHFCSSRCRPLVKELTWLSKEMIAINNICNIDNNTSGNKLLSIVAKTPNVHITAPKKKLDHEQQKSKSSYNSGENENHPAQGHVEVSNHEGCPIVSIGEDKEQPFMKFQLEFFTEAPSDNNANANTKKRKAAKETKKKQVTPPSPPSKRTRIEEGVRDNPKKSDDTQDDNNSIHSSNNKELSASSPSSTCLSPRSSTSWIFPKTEAAMNIRRATTARRSLQYPDNSSSKKTAKRNRKGNSKARDQPSCANQVDGMNHKSDSHKDDGDDPQESPLRQPPKKSKKEDEECQEVDTTKVPRWRNQKTSTSNKLPFLTPTPKSQSQSSDAEPKQLFAAHNDDYDDGDGDDDNFEDSADRKSKQSHPALEEGETSPPSQPHTADRNHTDDIISTTKGVQSLSALSSEQSRQGDAHGDDGNDEHDDEGGSLHHGASCQGSRLPNSADQKPTAQQQQGSDDSKGEMIHLLLGLKGEGNNPSSEIARVRTRESCVDTRQPVEDIALVKRDGCQLSIERPVGHSVKSISAQLGSTADEAKQQEHDHVDHGSARENSSSTSTSNDGVYSQCLQSQQFGRHKTQINLHGINGSSHAHGEVPSQKKTSRYCQQDSQDSAPSSSGINSQPIATLRTWSQPESSHGIGTHDSATSSSGIKSQPMTTLRTSSQKPSCPQYPAPKSQDKADASNNLPILYSQAPAPAKESKQPGSVDSHQENSPCSHTGSVSTSSELRACSQPASVANTTRPERLSPPLPGGHRREGVPKVGCGHYESLDRCDSNDSADCYSEGSSVLSLPCCDKRLSTQTELVVHDNTGALSQEEHANNNNESDVLVDKSKQHPLCDPLEFWREKKTTASKEKRSTAFRALFDIEIEKNRNKPSFASMCLPAVLDD